MNMSKGGKVKGYTNFLSKKNPIAVKAGVNSEKYKDLYSGGDKVNNKDYLPRFSKREMERDYKERVKRALYPKIIQEIISVYREGIYFDTEINRKDTKSGDLENYLLNADYKGNSHADLMQELFVKIEKLGQVDIEINFPEIPADLANTKATIIENDIHPYIIFREMSTRVDWHRDPFGNFKWIIYEENAEDYKDILGWTDSQVKSNKYVYKKWTEYYWAILNKSGAVLLGGEELGKHDLGIVPIVDGIIKPNDDNKKETGIGTVEDFEGEVIKIYDLNSQIDEIILNTAFPMLQLPRDVIDVMLKYDKSAKNLIPTSEEQGAIPGSYIEPSFQSLDKIFEHRRDISMEIYRRARIRISRDLAESGESKRQDTRHEINMLRSKAKMMESIENKIFFIVLKWLGVNMVDSEASVNYPSNYDVLTANEKLEQIKEVYSMDFGSVTMNRELLKTYIDSLFGKMNKDLKKSIIKEIEGFDPALDVKDMLVLATRNVFSNADLIKRYNSDKSESEIIEILNKNQQINIGEESAEKVVSNFLASAERAVTKAGRIR